MKTIVSDCAHGPGKTGTGRSWLGEDKLNRALVAGLMLEVILNQPRLPEPEDPKERRRQVKSRLKTTLVSRLAGHIPLSAFRDLAQNLDQWFDFFYPLITPRCSLAMTCRNLRDNHHLVSQNPLREDLLKECLAQLNGLLPTRRHRKIDREKLLAFLRHSGGEWFRLKDFEQFFHIDRKTAWEYIQKLLQADLLSHNQGRSAAVRYRLAPRFLE